MITFLTLPLEIRYNIYDFLFEQQPHSPDCDWWCMCPSRHLPILRACRQVHSEALPILYQHATLELTSSVDPCCTLNDPSFARLTLSPSSILEGLQAFGPDRLASLKKVSMQWFRGQRVVTDEKEVSLIRREQNWEDWIRGEKERFLRDCEKSVAAALSYLADHAVRIRELTVMWPMALTVGISENGVRTIQSVGTSTEDGEEAMAMPGDRIGIPRLLERIRGVEKLVIGQTRAFDGAAKVARRMGVRELEVCWKTGRGYWTWGHEEKRMLKNKGWKDMYVRGTKKKGYGRMSLHLQY